ncbi:MAG: DUF177 domain-containing protein [Lachnospiraceae bacterium]|nr:DUF177 domain-containing protein [Lachnospiraceae bacterium]
MMQINVSEILSTSGKSQSYQVEAGFDEVSYSGSQYPVNSKEPFTLTVENIGRKKIQVTGETKITLLIPCDRCLRDVSVEFPIVIDVTIDRNTEDDDVKEWNQLILLEGSMLAVDMLIYDEIAANMPMKILCKEDCKGICPVCGCNQNETTCDCDQSVPDPRMSAIRDIFNNFKEV